MSSATAAAAVEALTGGRNGARRGADGHAHADHGRMMIAAIRRYEESAGVVPKRSAVLSTDSREKTCHAVLAHGASGFVTAADPATLVRAVEEQAAPSAAWRSREATATGCLAALAKLTDPECALCRSPGSVPRWHRFRLRPERLRDGHPLSQAGSLGRASFARQAG